MTVYVDDFMVPATVGRIRARWSHLTADTRKELAVFAARLGLNPQWFQTCKHCDPATCHHFHYDVTSSKRSAAIELGAQSITYRQLGQIISARNPRRVK